MAEWSIAAVLKTVDLNGSGGSNPSSSAKHIEGRDSKLSRLLHFAAGQLAGACVQNAKAWQARVPAGLQRA